MLFNAWHAQMLLEVANVLRLLLVAQMPRLLHLRVQIGVEDFPCPAGRTLQREAVAPSPVSIGTCSTSLCVTPAGYSRTSDTHDAVSRMVSYGPVPWYNLPPRDFPARRWLAARQSSQAIL